MTGQRLLLVRNTQRNVGPRCIVLTEKLQFWSCRRNAFWSTPRRDLAIEGSHCYGPLSRKKDDVPKFVSEE